ncbi:MAG: alpha/beta hydrolase [Sphingobium sp.]|nr:alpha/beta hydrolase [Sphingobium sp.]
MSRHLVDPQLAAMLDLFAPLDMDLARIGETRAMFSSMNPPVEAYARPGVAIETRKIPGPAGAPDVPVILYRPNGAQGPLPVLLHIHGGGYLFGTAAGSGPSNVRTADELQCLVASVDYRLAPETRAPGALEDCYAVLAWLNKEAQALGIDPASIAVGGESAGGGLSAALAQLARDRGDYALCFQLLIYPMLDDRTAARELENPHVGHFVWTPEYNALGWACYTGQRPGAPDVPPYAVPARAADLSGLPPAYITVGALDLFLEEDMAYAARLMAAGVPVELHVLPGTYHAFEMVMDADLAIRSEAERRRALKAAFAK